MIVSLPLLTLGEGESVEGQIMSPINYDVGLRWFNERLIITIRPD